MKKIKLFKSKKEKEQSKYEASLLASAMGSANIPNHKPWRR